LQEDGCECSDLKAKEYWTSSGNHKWWAEITGDGNGQSPNLSGISRTGFSFFHSSN
jgi:hypothetical protein